MVGSQTDTCSIVPALYVGATREREDDGEIGMRAAFVLSPIVLAAFVGVRTPPLLLPQLKTSRCDAPAPRRLLLFQS